MEANKFELLAVACRGWALTILRVWSPAANAQGGKWVNLAPFPDPHEEVMGEAANGKMYVFAGLDSRRSGCPSAWCTSTTRHEPVDEKEAHGSALPPPCPHRNDGKIYVFGGFTQGKSETWPAWTPINNALEYDPVNDSWKALAPMPTKRGAAVAARWAARCTSSAARPRLLAPPTLHSSHNAPARARNRRGVRSQDQHLARTHRDANAAQPHGRRNRQREDLRDRRTNRSGIYCGLVRPRNVKPTIRRPIPGAARSPRCQRRAADCDVGVYKGRIYVAGGEKQDFVNKPPIRV